MEGEMPLTRIPSGEYSAARCRVIMSTTPLVAPYHVRPVVGFSVIQEPILTMLPLPLSKKYGTSALVAWKILLTLMSKTSIQQDQIKLALAGLFSHWESEDSITKTGTEFYLLS